MTTWLMRKLRYKNRQILTFSFVSWLPQTKSPSSFFCQHLFVQFEQIRQQLLITLKRLGAVALLYCQVQFVMRPAQAFGHFRLVRCS